MNGNPTEAIWYVVLNDEQVGPVSAQDIASYYASGQLTADAYVWCDGFADWQQLQATEQFSFLFAPPDDGAIDDEGETRVTMSPFVMQQQAEDAGAEHAFESQTAAYEAESFQGFGQELSVDDNAGGGVAAGGVAAGGAAAGGFDAAAAFGSSSDDGQGFAFGGSLDNPPVAGQQFESQPAGGDVDESLSNFVAPEPEANGLANDLIGARSENSVLFSLSNLQAVSARVTQGNSSTPVSEGSGLIDVKALATSGPATTRRRSFEQDAYDNAVPVAAMLPLGTRKSNTGLIIGIVAGAVVLVIALIIVLIIVLTSSDKPAPQVAANMNTASNPNLNPNDLGVVQAQKVQQAGKPESQRGGNSGAQQGNSGGNAGNGQAAGNNAQNGDNAAGNAAKNDAAAGAADAGKDGGKDAAGDGGDGGSDNGADDGKDDGKQDAKADKGKQDKKRHSSKGKRGSRDKKKDAKPAKSKDTKKSSKPKSGKKPKKPAAAKPAAGGAKLTRADVQSVIRKNFGKIRTCSRTSAKKGTMKVSFVIKGDGRVGRAKVNTGSFAGTPAATCVLRVVKGMRFKATGGKDMPVNNYPFTIQ